jgi:hypothetical protein
MQCCSVAAVNGGFQQTILSVQGIPVNAFKADIREQTKGQHNNYIIKPLVDLKVNLVVLVRV